MCLAWGGLLIDFWTLMLIFTVGGWAGGLGVFESELETISVAELSPLSVNYTNSEIEKKSLHATELITLFRTYDNNDRVRYERFMLSVIYSIQVCLVTKRS